MNGVGHASRRPPSSRDFKLPNPLSSQPVTAGEGTTTRYAYKASLVGAAHQFELTDSGLTWRIAGRSGTWPYADIAAVRLSYRPVSMQARRFRADIWNRNGGRLRLLSTSWQTATLMAPQDHLYRDFIVALHQRLRDSDSTALLTGGIGRTAYFAALALIGLVTIAMVGLLVRALSTREFTGALFLLGFAALFVWQVGGFLVRNRPRQYRFDELPVALLP